MVTSTEQMPPMMSVPFEVLTKPHWFKDEADSAVLFWIVTTIWTDYDGPETAKRFPFEIPLEYPVKVTIAELPARVSLPFLDVVTTGNSSGEPVHNVEITSSRLPPGVYLIFATPFRADGIDLSEEEARARLDASASLLAINAGRNLIKEIRFEGVYSGSTGLQAWSKAQAVCDRVHGPYLDEPPWQQVSQTLAALGSKQVARETRDKVRRALHFLARAIKSDEPFIFYWIAFEILCNGTSNAIRGKLAKIYGAKKDQQIHDFTGFLRLKDLRHKLVHEGDSSKLMPIMERYLQVLLIDILNFELKLPCARQAIKFQSQIGDAISEIGVPKDWCDHLPPFGTTKDQ